MTVAGSLIDEQKPVGQGASSGEKPVDLSDKPKDQEMAEAQTERVPIESKGEPYESNPSNGKTDLKSDS